MVKGLSFFCKAGNHLIILLPSKLKKFCMFSAQQKKNHSLEKKKKSDSTKCMSTPKFGDSIFL